MRFIILLFGFTLALSSATNSSGSEENIAQQVSFNAGLSKVDTAVLNCLANQARQLILLKKNDSQAKRLIDSAYTLAQINAIEIPPLLHLASAEYYLSLKDFAKSSDYLKQAYESNKSKKDIDFYILLTDCNARYCLWAGLFNECIDRYNENLKISEKHFVNGLKPKSYLGLSNVYTTLNNQNESIHYLELMLETAKAEKNLYYLEIAHSNLGIKMMNFKKRYDLAQYHFKQGLAISNSQKDTLKIYTTKSRIAWNYYLQNKLDSSLLYYNSMLSDIRDDYSYLSNTYGNIGTIYRDKKDFVKANENYNKAIQYALKVKSLFNLSWIYKDMSDMYKRNTDFENAYKYYVLHKSYSDSLNTNSFNQGLINARVKFEANEKEQKVELLSLKIKNQRLIIYGFAGFLALSLLIGYLLVRQSRLNAKRKISEMNQKISEITQANLRQQMNPHFIFNTLNSIQYYMYQHDKLATNDYLTKFSSLMRRILENSQHTSIPLNDELEAVNLYLELESVRFKNKFDYNIKIDDEIDTLLYKIPTMLIQPYVENAICHGLIYREKKGYLKIEINLKPNHLACVIEDNGIGREAAMEIRRKKEINHNSLGTKITQSRLDLVNLLYGTSLKTIYTDLTNELGEPNGTRVEIQIPILT